MDNLYDLTIIGGGPGGYAAAIRASQLGLKVAVVEEREMGGTCLNRGCIPAKALLHAAELYQEIRHCADFGLSAGQASFDYGKMAARKDAVVRQLRTGVENLVKGHGGTMLAGRARIKDKQTILISGKDEGVIRTGQLIIATGSRPARPPIPGIGGSRILDSDGMLELTECPERLTIIGGGVIGVEFATLFISLGKAVTILEMMPSLVPGLDAELAAALRASLARKGVKVCTGAQVAAVQSGEEAICAYLQEGLEKTVKSDIILIATGRKPNTEGFGLENLNLQLAKGFIPVNSRMETGVPGVFAVGDVIGRAQLAHAASAQGLVAAANAAGQDRRLDDAAMPACLYTSPEIAWIGLTEQEAVKGGHSVKTGKFPVNANSRSLIMKEKEGFCQDHNGCGDRGDSWRPCHVRRGDRTDCRNRDRDETGIHCRGSRRYDSSASDNQRNDHGSSP